MFLTKKILVALCHNFIAKGIGTNIFLTAKLFLVKKKILVAICTFSDEIFVIINKN